MAKNKQKKVEFCSMIIGKEYVLKEIQACVDYVCANCFFCDNCWKCLVTKKLQKEAAKKKLKSSEVGWWSINWVKDKSGNSPAGKSREKSLQVCVKICLRDLGNCRVLPFLYFCKQCHLL